MQNMKQIGRWQELTKDNPLTPLAVEVMAGAVKNSVNISTEDLLRGKIREARALFDEGKVGSAYNVLNEALKL